jgi:hypothetical protein
MSRSFGYLGTGPHYEINNFDSRPIITLLYWSLAFAVRDIVSFKLSNEGSIVVPSFSAAEQRHHIVQGGVPMPAKLVAIVGTVFALLLFGVAFAGSSVLYGGFQNPIVGFAHDVYTIEETAGEVLIPIRINEAPAAGEDVVVEFSTVPGTAEEGTGGDYLASTAVLTFTHTSDATQFVSITVLNDMTMGEPDETVNLILQLLTPDTGRLGRGAATLVITDDDLPPPTPTREQAYVQPVFKPLDPSRTPPPPPPP